ncbi:MAG: methylated-DNA--[protein]-cysteine S-methyltransferase [Defluviitaleaceae bacterium]|nr:methylated-DNA--[protein]-cysteine S-methyltransferase [Defluviitaleaceae bacterium]
MIYCESPIGFFKIVGADNFIVSCELVESCDEQHASRHGIEIQFANELTEYFSKKRREFTVSVKPQGTAFQMHVWDELLKIPYGETVSYKKIAERINNPNAVRAVGGANNKNPIMILVPCHRVIGASGSLVGFGGGLWRKKYLLDLEKE